MLKGFCNYVALDVVIVFNDPVESCNLVGERGERRKEAVMCWCPV